MNPDMVRTSIVFRVMVINPLAPNDAYISCTAQLTSRRCILKIYSTNIILFSFYWASVANAPNVLQPYWLIVLPLDVPDR